MRTLKIALTGLSVLGIICLLPHAGSLSPNRAMAGDSVQLNGLLAPARVVSDSNHIPHIIAGNDHDALLLLGYVHARDRFFQMDLLRRQASGTAAEVLGQAALASDTRVRALGLRRAAEASLGAYSGETQALLQAYADGVNAYLTDANSALPAEYKALELTKASVPAWTPVDSLAVGKVISFQLSFSDEDISLTQTLAAYQKAAAAGGFDANALLFQDTLRSAPFDPSISIPGFLAASTKNTGLTREALIAAARDLPRVAPETLKLAEQYLANTRKAPLFAGTLDTAGGPAGSNWWIISGRLTDSGYPMLANDPHLSLVTPPVWYEAHLTVSADPARGPMNVVGVSFPGVPGIILGCNERICWGATVNPLDVTDVYQERLVVDLATLTPQGTVFEGRVEPLVILPQTFRVNQPGNGVQDDVVPANVGPLDGGIALVVPRRNNGPIVSLDISNPLNITALSIQYTGWGPTRELQTFLAFGRAAGLDDFKRGLRYFTFGSQNFAYADVDGNIAYFTSAELPLREDLQTLGRPDGAPPFLIRDGTHTFKNEWLPVANAQPEQGLPYEILPFAEMPQVVNPSQGYILSANSDPVGTTLGNNPLGRLRAGGGVYYLNYGYDAGFRIGRISGLVRDIQTLGKKISINDMASLQANNQMLDAQVFVPYIGAALANAGAAGAPPALAALARDPEVAEAVGRMLQWDFSTPTGIHEGYDPGEDPLNLPEPSSSDVRNSVAATLYSVWRGQAVGNIIDATLARLGLGQVLPLDDRALIALRNLLDTFPKAKGRGASGVNFFEVSGAPTPEAARDILLLRSVRAALDLLAGDSFSMAFANSKNQDDYRWGKLHRIVFAHVLGNPFSIPVAAGFQNLGPGLPGVARTGGFGVLDASNHAVRATRPSQFMFASGPSRRFIGELSPNGLNLLQIIPGGESAVLGSAAYADMMGRWLTNSYHPMSLTMAQVEADRVSEEQFVPAPGK